MTKHEVNLLSAEQKRLNELRRLVAETEHLLRPESSLWPRKREQIELGENFAFGPYYSSCIEHYFENELGDKIPNNKLLDHVAEVLSLPRDKIVPVMANSCNEGEYLAGHDGIKEVIAFSGDLDIVVFKTTDQALEFRKYAPILLPRSSTEEAMGLDGAKEIPNRDETIRESKEELREYISLQFAIFFTENISLHLGADECVKAVMRRVAESQEDVRMIMSVPNYFDALSFADLYDLKVHPTGYDKESFFKAIDELDSQEPVVLYLSNPNNPLGFDLTVDEILEIDESLPVGSTIILDETNIHIKKEMVTQDWLVYLNEIKSKLYIIGSPSKSDALVSERVGFMMSNNPEEVQALRKLEPPAMSGGAQAEISLSHEEQVWHRTRRGLVAFRYKLEYLCLLNKEKARLIPSQGNFAVVLFKDLKLRDAFLREIGNIDTEGAGFKEVLALPLVGAGVLEDKDLNKDGSLNVSMGRKGIAGLPEEGVRINCLSHPAILDCLEKVLN